MNRAFLIILIPAMLAGLGYVLVFRHEGIPVRPFPLVMATAGFIVAAGLVHRYQRRKRRARSS
jgi:ABC-type Fe3+ transport system permease subunit